MGYERGAVVEVHGCVDTRRVVADYIWNWGWLAGARWGWRRRWRGWWIGGGGSDGGVDGGAIGGGEDWCCWLHLLDLWGLLGDGEDEWKEGKEGQEHAHTFLIFGLELSWAGLRERVKSEGGRFSRLDWSRAELCPGSFKQVAVSCFPNSSQSCDGSLLDFCRHSNLSFRDSGLPKVAQKQKGMNKEADEERKETVAKNREN